MSYEIAKEKNGKFHFHLKASNGQIILSSQAYKEKSGAEEGIASVRTNGTKDTNFERKNSTADQPYFVLKAHNGQVIGTSQMYKSHSGRNGGIKSVQKNCTSKVVKDLT